jgi:hypothetical protein
MVFERTSRVVRVVKGAAERGEREVLAIRFPSEYCTDGGCAINSFETCQVPALFRPAGGAIVRKALG